MSWGLPEFLQGFAQGDRNALARAITLVESKLPEHQALAAELLEKLPKPKRPTRRIGISGTPGVGKSTFIESFGLSLLQQGHQLAVLAVDPTSQVSGGSILGDKTRMEELSRAPGAFIRPSPSGGALGGVARRTREAVLLCEAFGFDRVLVETVGVGQSETTVAELVDCFMMLLQPGAGDDLQGIKRGILELVDVVVVTKADGAQAQAAHQAAHHYRQALHILRQEGWHPPVLACSALEKTGLSEISAALDGYFKQLGTKLELKRSQQGVYWLETLLDESLKDWFRNRVPKAEYQRICQEVASGKKSVGPALKALLSHLPS